MPTPFKIAITKEIIRRSKNCGTENDAHTVGNNCAIAIALTDIFPNVYVTDNHIFPFGTEYKRGQDLSIPLPVIARQFIKLFDGFYLTPNLRLLLPEFDFTIDIPDEVIEQINIDEVRELVIEHKKIPAYSFNSRSCLREPSML